jgi:hypothetical protein
MTSVGGCGSRLAGLALDEGAAPVVSLFIVAVGGCCIFSLCAAVAEAAPP